MDKQIDQETLIEIVKDAQMTPSWANSQPWRVYIATSETLKQIQKAHLAYVQQGIRGNADFSTMHREDWEIKSRRDGR